MSPSDQDPILEYLRGEISEVRGQAIECDNVALAGKSLTEDIGLDSLDLISLLFRIEEQRGIKIPEADVDTHELTVVGHLASYIRRAEAA